MHMLDGNEGLKELSLRKERGLEHYVSTCILLLLCIIYNTFIFYFTSVIVLCDWEHIKKCNALTISKQTLFYFATLFWFNIYPEYICHRWKYLD